MTAGRQFTVDHDFPGGNIIVETIEGDTVFLRPDLRDTAGHWFYWAFRVRGAEGRTLRFEFVDGDVIGARGPAIRVDDGLSYRHLGLDRVDGRGFRYTFGSTDRAVRFAVAIPYLLADFEAFLDEAAAASRDGDSSLRVETLCTSEGGRPVPVLYCGGDAAGYKVILTARHHACESLASFTLEGFLRAAVAGDRLGEWFRENVQILAVPFVDIDGVADGDQGKNRRPHDHNRDYGQESIYRSVRALKELVPTWSAGAFTLALDLHCPYLKGGNSSEDIHFVGSPEPENWARTMEFCDTLEEVQRGPLRYSQTSNIPYGAAWNVGKTGVAESCSRWMGTLETIHFGTTIEIPYATACGVEVNPSTARALGRDLARAVRAYRHSPRAR